MKKEIAVAKLLGCWRRRGSAHPGNRLFAESRFRLWESKLAPLPGRPRPQYRRL